MRYEEVLPVISKTSLNKNNDFYIKKIGRSIFDIDGLIYPFGIRDFEADDWEIVEELKKENEIGEKQDMKKYTDTELLETLLPMLNYSIMPRVDAGSILDTVDFTILESNELVSKSFVVALQNRMNELAKRFNYLRQ